MSKLHAGKPLKSEPIGLLDCSENSNNIITPRNSSAYGITGNYFIKSGRHSSSIVDVIKLACFGFRKPLLQ